MQLRAGIIVIVLILFSAQTGRTCSICDPNFQQRPTLRQSARTAKIVVLGTLANARLNGEKGLTDFKVETVVSGEDVVVKRMVLTIPSYIPFNVKKPPRYIFFGDFNNDKFEAVRGVPVQGDVEGITDYLRASLRIDERDRLKVLQFCYKHLDSANADVAGDAFHEFAKATDLEVAALAGKLPPDKFRKLLTDPAHPERHGISAFLLGACGTKDDAALLLSKIQTIDERGNPALSGLLGGLIELRPQDGWAALLQILRDPKRHFADKLAAIGTLRFYHACKPKENRSEIMRGLEEIVELGDFADMAVEDMRRWQWWDATKQIIAQYCKPSHSAPLVKRAIVRYALCCPTAEAAEFVKARRLAEPELVKHVEESLEFEKPLAVQPKGNR